MRSMNKFYFKHPDVDLLTGLNSMHQDIIEHSKFFKTLFGQSQREPAAVNRYVELLKYVGKGSDVVFVAVGEDDRGEVIAIFFEKIEVGNGNVDTERRFLGKAHARVDDDHLVAEPDAHAVHPEFTDPAERYYFYLSHCKYLTLKYITPVSVVSILTPRMLFVSVESTICRRGVDSLSRFGSIVSTTLENSVRYVGENIETFCTRTERRCRWSFSFGEI